jgi:chorismate-pyruvate lyase
VSANRARGLIAEGWLHVSLPRERFYDEPLVELFTKQGWPVPEFSTIEPAGLPGDVAPFFDHDLSMTSRLQTLFGEAIKIRIVAVHHTETVYRRLVLLHTIDDPTPLLLGAIDIHLDRFESPVRLAIEQAAQPFGKILKDMTVVHGYEPYAYFTFRPGAEIATLLATDAGSLLYGRRKVVFGENDRMLALVTEIPARHRLGPRPAAV